MKYNFSEKFTTSMDTENDSTPLLMEEGWIFFLCFFYGQNIFPMYAIWPIWLVLINYLDNSFFFHYFFWLAALPCLWSE